jgi:hypothetical protein
VISRIALLAALALGSAGCVNVTSSVAGQNAVNGEAWYVRNTGIFGFVFAADVFYCPPPTGEGPAACQQAQMYGEDDPFTAAATKAVEEKEDEPEEKKEPKDEKADAAEDADEG